MDSASLRSGLEQIAADLTIAGEPVPFDLVVERHLSLFSQARTAGLRASSIAKLLADAGAQRPDGTPITADQLRASISRAKRRRASTASGLPQIDVQRTIATGASTSPPTFPRPAPDRGAPATATLSVPTAQRSLSDAVGTIDSEVDLSDTEVRVARERLRRS